MKAGEPMNNNRYTNVIKLLAVVAITATIIQLPRPLLGQSNEGSLAGTVKDNAGAVIADASLVATNEQTHQVANSKTSNDGQYRFLRLPIGTYTVEVSKQGFATKQDVGVVIQIETTTALDVTLSVGSANQTVTVAADALTLQTESTDVGTVVTPQEVETLPLSVGSGAMRDATTFAFLAPATYGVGTTGGTFEAAIAGGQAYGAEVLLDGASLETASFGDGWNNEVIGSIDAFQELKVFTAGLPAQYGRTGGGIQSYVTKSGTNIFHGSAYEIFRNTVLDANNWFSNAYDVPRSPDQKNEYGLTLGGPVWIPKAYNGRDKTFFFFSWEQFRQNVGFSNLLTVPTTANRNGDFSAQLTNNVVGTNPCDNQPIYEGEIFNPATTQVVNGIQCRTPYPNNVITSGFSSVAQAILKYVPQPTNQNLVNNFFYSGSLPVTDTAETIRIDDSLNEHNSIFGSYNVRENTHLSTQTPNIPLPFTPAMNGQDVASHFFRVGFDHTFSNNLVNNLHLGIGRVLNHEGYVTTWSGGTNYDSLLGLPGGSGPMFPGILFNEGATSNVGNLGAPYENAGFNSSVSDNNLEVADDLAWLKGRHNVTVGVDLRYILDISSYLNNLNGTFVFGRPMTAGDQLQTNTSGNGIASFLLGQVAQATAVRNLATPRNIGHYSAGYAEDEYKIAPNLTISFGVRYAVDLPDREAHDDSSQFDPATINTATGTPGALVIAGTGSGRSGLSSRWERPFYGDVEPRIGFAYSPKVLSKTVVFGNYGIVSNPLSFWGQIYNGVPAGFSSTAFVTNNASQGFGAAESLDTGGVPQPSTSIYLNNAQLNNYGINYTEKSFGHPGINQTWSLSVQHELAQDLILTLSYLGQNSTHLPSGLENINNLNPEYFGLGSVLTQNVYGNSAGVPVPYQGFQGSVSQALVPFPQYGQINTIQYGENVGVSRYAAFTAKLERRYHNGLSLLGSYTWSKNLTNAGYQTLYWTTAQNPFNRQAEISYSPQDVPQIVSLSYVYELPFGKGKMFANQSNFLNAIVGGWSISAVQRYQSGQVIGFGCATGIPSFDNCIRWNRAPGVPMLSTVRRSGHSGFNPLKDNWYNPACVGSVTTNCAFMDPNRGSVISSGGAYSFGNMAPYYGSNRYFPYLDEDFAFSKTVPLVEHAKFIFRGELFNAFNRTVFGAPDSEPYDGGSFGTVGYQYNSPRNVQFTGRIEF